jgi:hypothetical protein
MGVFFTLTRKLSPCFYLHPLLPTPPRHLKLVVVISKLLGQTKNLILISYTYRVQNIVPKWSLLGFCLFMSYDLFKAEPFLQLGKISVPHRRKWRRIYWISGNGIAAKLNGKMQFGNFRFSPLDYLPQLLLICMIIYQVFIINVLCDLGRLKNNGLILGQGYH